VAGAGRVGSRIAGVLRELDLPFVLIELDHRRLDQARQNGYPIIFGDASQPTVLEAAGVARARLLLVTTPVHNVSIAILQHARALNPSIRTVARAEGEEAMAALHQMGVAEVVQPELEASLEMTRQALLHLRIPSLEIIHLTDRLRSEHYAPAYDRHAGEYELVTRLGAAARQLDLQWVRIDQTSAVAGRTIGELDVRATTGVSIVGVVGALGFTASPGADFRLAPGDLVSVIGDRAHIDVFEELAAPRLETSHR
jgi:monovalent cation:H+ antiporter-2, CPA2 family